MGLAWFGNTDYCDDGPPEIPVPVICEKCGKHDTWLRPMTYNGAPPKTERSANFALKFELAYSHSVS